MFNFKKSVLASIVLMGMAASAGANAASNATVVWSGTVPTANASDKLVITGQFGDLTSLTGVIKATSDGQFETNELVLESHANTGTAASPVVGDLASANWTLSNASITYDGLANAAQIIEVEVNGAAVAVGGEIKDVETISTKIKQTNALPEAEVGNTTVQATLTVMADIV